MAPLGGHGVHTRRWVLEIVTILLVVFLILGIIYFLRRT